MSRTAPVSPIDAWADNPIVKTAVANVGWPQRGDLVDVLEEIGRITEGIAELRARGVDLDDVAAMVSDVQQAEALQGEAWNTTADSERALSKPAQAAVHRLFLVGFSEAEIARILGLGVRRVSRSLAARRIDTRQQRVLDLHRKGLRVGAIAKELGLDFYSVEAALRLAGVEPLKRTPPVTPEQAEEIRNLRLAGHSGPAIAQRLGLSIDRVNNVLYPRKRRGPK